MLLLGIWDLLVMAGGVIVLLSLPAALIIFVLKAKQRGDHHTASTSSANPTGTNYDDSPRTNA